MGKLLVSADRLQALAKNDVNVSWQHSQIRYFIECLTDWWRTLTHSDHILAINLLACS